MVIKEIPQPKTDGDLGNLLLLNKEKPLQSLMKIADQMGEIFKFETPNQVTRYVSSQRLVKEVCDESRFDKNIGPALKNVRSFAGDGLFTSWSYEKNWKKAHNILLPIFSQQAMKGYHAMMVDIAMQLIQKWERLNADEHIDVPEDMTRLTLDTIGLCGFNYRFNSFYRDQPHPFIMSMVRALDESMSQLQRVNPDDPSYKEKKFQLQKDIQYMNGLVDKIIADRKISGEQGDDLLAHMLNGKDPETGEVLDDENIRYQMITFLIAGHETTSGLLSFALYFLVKNPHILHKATEEATRVLIDPVPTYRQVKQLKYITMVLNESLRLWPTAPAFSLYPKEDTVLGGEYLLKQGEEIKVLIPQLHRDKIIWGEDVEEFRPERFENPSTIPQHAFKPFGNGQRACIGQQFAIHEATLVLGMMLKHFDFYEHENYELDIKETLTLKPEGLTLKAVSKKIPLGGIPAPYREQPEKNVRKVVDNVHNTPLLVLYGSNMGTSEGIARELVDIALSKGFAAQAASLDSHAGNLPKKGVVLIISASYNGNPPDNAKKFVEWLEKASEHEVKGVHYAVFGCGDKSWATTYQKVPFFIDEQLAIKGAERLTERGEGDASDDFEEAYEEWREQLWNDVADYFNLDIKGNETSASTLSLEYIGSRAVETLTKVHSTFTAQVDKNKELQQPCSARSTRHLEISLPSNVTYKEGDHLGVIPINYPELVNRVLTRFQLNGSHFIRLTSDNKKLVHLPLGRTVSINELLQFVELQEPVTRHQLRAMAAKTVCPPHKIELEALLEKHVYKEQVLSRRLTMLELLERYPACEMEFSNFIELLPALRPRYYSISSSPRVNDQKLSITVGVVEDNAWSGNGKYRGIASTYLAQLKEGDSITCFISNSQSGFELPKNPNTPIIMVGPGTGIAPFRGFLQARKSMKINGESLGEAHLYFGCRSPQEDYLYQEELEQTQKEGIMVLHTAFSRMKDQPKIYVQHLIKQDAEKVINLLNQGAHLYICGDGRKMAPDLENTLIKCYANIHNVSEQQASAWLQQLEENLYYSKDVWAG
ncbi:bifunctional cytochrome P450/NADPH--P450 reductase [Bacillus wiedmannii]|uniref:Bifunctional cytochrome P450/NADPH--P450 reductase n=1 Tax=Bacillus wiedmannii TaxID=1890302 RepID=A0A2C5NTS2_9BACI|nr:cytochrome P450 [Bacillus wiedmannii]PEJ94865.1 NADPH--cytochrome reductase [Bacillus wiedmannii]PEM34549.1 NADPH--cytochrome reductase [Bacillus wiedmannii]PEP31730.1 NADPH--cytochrome reductase [Bacillus wiedmannii]PFZ47010.1 NADPH--cytochrome reductase [Bacillus wiedmannii]PGA89495.1 NADPH--cytochrome reductase [Bacillus wiedmannii]